MQTGMVMYASYLSTWDIEVSYKLLLLCREFRSSLDFYIRPCLQKERGGGGEEEEMKEVREKKKRNVGCPSFRRLHIYRHSQPQVKVFGGKLSLN